MLDLTNKVRTSNIQNTETLTRLETEIPSPDIRHIWLQDPVRLEDPLGRYLPIPSEYSYGMMKAVIREQFRTGPGARRVRSGDYEIANSRNCQQLISEDTFTGLIPGMQLRMAVLLDGLLLPTDGCPMPNCGSQRYTDCRGGGKIWLGSTSYSFQGLRC